jgi:uncharacterized protein
MAEVTHELVYLPVTRDLDGSDVRIVAHRLVGRLPGPTLGIFGAQHGDEWICSTTLNQAIQAIETLDFAGTILVVPVCNPVAFRDGRRLTQIEADEPDMNRVWGGSFTWMANMLVQALDPLVRECDAIIDYHPGNWGLAMANMWWSEDLPDQDVSARSKELAIAFGTSVQSRKGLQHPGSGTLAAYAGVHLGIPTICGGLGGSGFALPIERTWEELAVQGIVNVMAALGMHDAKLRLPASQLHFSRTVRVHPSVGGLLMPLREPGDEQNPRVEQGELLGRILCPYTFDTLEELVAPSAGWLYWWARSYPVRPGCFAFGFAAEDSAEWVVNQSL